MIIVTVENVSERGVRRVLGRGLIDPIRGKGRRYHAGFAIGGRLAGEGALLQDVPVTTGPWHLVLRALSACLSSGQMSGSRADHLV